MLVLPQSVTTQDARDTQRMLSLALQNEVKTQNEPQVTVDASALQQFDSAALGVLLECQRLATAWGKGFAVRNAPKKLAELARLYGVDALLMAPAEAPTTPTAAA